jgi:hypothetical protein
VAHRFSFNRLREGGHRWCRERRWRFGRLEKEDDSRVGQYRNFQEKWIGLLEPFGQKMIWRENGLQKLFFRFWNEVLSSKSKVLNTFKSNLNWSQTRIN